MVDQPKEEEKHPLDSSSNQNLVDLQNIVSAKRQIEDIADKYNVKPRDIFKVTQQLRVSSD